MLNKHAKLIILEIPNSLKYIFINLENLNIFESIFLQKSSSRSLQKWRETFLGSIFKFTDVFEMWAVLKAHPPVLQNESLKKSHET